MNHRQVWAQARDNLVYTVTELGFPEDFGHLIAKELGSPKAMERMTVYLENVKPRSTVDIVDEMLAIKSDIEAWRELKASREANAKYNEILYFGLNDD